MRSFVLYRMNARLKEIELNDDDSVKCFRLVDGSTIEGDLYVSAMPGMRRPHIALHPQMSWCTTQQSHLQGRFHHYKNNSVTVTMPVSLSPRARVKVVEHNPDGACVIAYFICAVTNIQSVV